MTGHFPRRPPSAPSPGQASHCRETGRSARRPGRLPGYHLATEQFDASRARDAAAHEGDHDHDRAFDPRAETSTGSQSRDVAWPALDSEGLASIQTDDDWRVTRRQKRSPIRWRAERSRLRRFGSRCSAMAYPCSLRSAAGSWPLSARQEMLQNRPDRASRQGASPPFGARHVFGRHAQQRAPFRLSQIIDRARHFDLASGADLPKQPVFPRADGSRDDGTQLPRAPAFPFERGTAVPL